jgi:hypothetical protein
MIWFASVVYSHSYLYYILGMAGGGKLVLEK